MGGEDGSVRYFYCASLALNYWRIIFSEPQIFPTDVGAIFSLGQISATTYLVPHGFMAWRHMHGALGCRNGEAMVLGYLDNVLTVLGCSSEARMTVVEGRCFDP